MAESAAEIRKANMFGLLRAIHALPPATRKELAEESGLSVATVSSIVSDLIAAGAVIETGTRKQATGRPTAELALNADHGIVLGVDVAETYVHAETFDSALRARSSTSLPLDAHQNDPADVTLAVKKAISQEVARPENEGKRILGVCVSIPGQVDPVGGTSVFAPNWNWHQVPLLPFLRDAIDAPLILENPLKALALAELWAGSGRNASDFVVLNIGTGVGAGLAFGGEVFRGRTNSAGEWGHMVLVAGGRACRCGSRGCVEAYVGAPGIMETVTEIVPGSPLLGSGDQTIAIEALAEAVDRGDPSAVAVLERTAYYLGSAMANLVNLLNPELLVLSGWVVDVLGDRLLSRARPHVKAYALGTPLQSCRIEIQAIAGNSVSFGTATLALESHLASIGRVQANVTPRLNQIA